MRNVAKKLCGSLNPNHSTIEAANGCKGGALLNKLKRILRIVSADVSTMRRMTNTPFDFNLYDKSTYI